MGQFFFALPNPTSNYEKPNQRASGGISELIHTTQPNQGVQHL
jgi:hypothetical protein